MSLLHDILSWSTKKLPLWQQDAVRRLFEKEELSQDDFDDLYAMLKSAHGIIDEQNRTPIPFSKDQLPQTTSSASTTILNSLKDLRHVNKIATGQTIEFAPIGVTIIFGDNGSGKSGYARVLKHACRARDNSEKIHTDASDKSKKNEIPEATFDIQIDNNSQTLHWQRDQVPPQELSTIAVFDSKCARAYLDNEQEAAYLPYGLDIVESLANIVLPELQKRLTSEMLSIDTSKESFNDLLGETAVGKLVENLSHTTKTKSVTDLATVSEEEKQQLETIEKTLSENNPAEKAKQLRLSIQRIENLIETIDSAYAWVKDEAIEKIKGIDTEAESATSAEKIAANNFRSGEELLNGTGDSAWKTLFDAAKVFSTTHAYPEHDFPYTGDDSQCPLCQQNLDDNAKERLHRFEKYITDNVSKLATEKTEKRNTATEKLQNCSVSIEMKSALKEELNQIDKNIVKNIEKYEKSLGKRKEWVSKALTSHSWDNPPTLSDDPRISLKSMIEAMRKQAEDLDKASDEENRKSLENKQAELRARINLSTRQKALVKLIERIQIKHNLKKCEKDLKTRPISDKAKELSNLAVTNELKTSLDNELKTLGVGHIQTVLKDRTSKGKLIHKLVLDLPVTVDLNEILSEGEQRAIAIASFLAEMKLGNHAGGIIFDDPVSSLDHFRRQNVAKRLAEEGTRRQVIVFTHDTVFLHELIAQIEQQKIAHRVCYLDWLGKNPGNVNEGLPWIHKTYKERIDKLEKEQKSLKRNWPEYPNETDNANMAKAYDHFRATIERVIQDFLFNGVVKRYRDWINVSILEPVVGFTQPEHDEIARLHKKCCDVVDAHDPSSEKNAPVPDPTELEKDIEDLNKLIESIRIRRKSKSSSQSQQTSGASTTN